jgi:hypothetical protein
VLYISCLPQHLDGPPRSITVLLHIKHNQPKPTKTKNPTDHHRKHVSLVRFHPIQHLGVDERSAGCGLAAAPCWAHYIDDWNEGLTNEI